MEADEISITHSFEDAKSDSVAENDSGNNEIVDANAPEHLIIPSRENGSISAVSQPRSDQSSNKLVGTGIMDEQFGTRLNGKENLRKFFVSFFLG